MADSTITGLSSAAAVSGTEVLPIDQSGATKKVTIANLTPGLDEFVGDVGSPSVGGTKGLVPAPSAGDGGNFLKGDGTWAAPSGGASSLLAVTSYQGSGGDATYTISSATFTDVDATNVKVTFIAPASGNVLVRVTVPGLANSVGNAVFFDLRESTTDIGMLLMISGTQIQALSAAFYVTGVTAGSHTYKLGWRNLSGTATLYYGSSTRGPVVMEVWAAP